MINQVPPIDTEIVFKAEQASLSKDGRSYICRITYDETIKNWVIAAVFNNESLHWVPITKTRRIGLIVFLNDRPEPTDTHIRITKIQPTGKGVYADTLSK